MRSLLLVRALNLHEASAVNDWGALWSFVVALLGKLGTDTLGAA